MQIFPFWSADKKQGYGEFFWQDGLYYEGTLFRQILCLDYIKANGIMVSNMEKAYSRIIKELKSLESGKKVKEPDG